MTSPFSPSFITNKDPVAPIKNDVGFGSGSTSSVREDLGRISGSRIDIADEVLFKGPVTFAVLPSQIPSKFTAADATPSVLNRTRLIAGNTVAHNITNFKFGQEGQEIKIKGDGFSTVVNGTSIKTNTAANKLLAVSKVYTFTMFLNIWYENA